MGVISQSDSDSPLQSEQGRTEKKTSSLKFKICRVKIIVKNVGKSNSWSTSPCLSKAEQSRIIRIRQRQWISIRVGCKWILHVQRAEPLLQSSHVSRSNESKGNSEFFYWTKLICEHLTIGIDSWRECNLQCL